MGTGRETGVLELNHKYIVIKSFIKKVVDGTPFVIKIPPLRCDLVLGTKCLGFRIVNS